MRHKLTLNSTTLAAAVFVATYLAFGHPASAGTPADDLIKQGLDLRRAGRDMDALAKFENAYGLAKAPRAAAQWGLCLQAASRWSEAEPLISEALSSPQDPWIKKNRDTLKDSLEAVKTHVGRLDLSGDPVGATIRVCGNIVGTFPLPRAITVNEGVVDVEVSADGYEQSARSITLPGASYQRLVIRLKKTKVSPVEPVPVATAEQASAPEEHSAVLATSPATSDEERPITKSPWLWAGVGVVVVGAVVAVVLLSGGTTYPNANEVRSVP